MMITNLTTGISLVLSFFLMENALRTIKLPFKFQPCLISKPHPPSRLSSLPRGVQLATLRQMCGGKKAERGTQNRGLTLSFAPAFHRIYRLSHPFERNRMTTEMVQKRIPCDACASDPPDLSLTSPSHPPEPLTPSNFVDRTNQHHEKGGAYNSASACVGPECVVFAFVSRYKYKISY